MTLLKISGDGIENNAITNAHLHSAANITQSKLNLVSTDSLAGLTVKGDGTTDGYLQLNCSQNSHGIKLKSPAHSASQSYTLTFPSSIVNNGALLTDSNGNLSTSLIGTSNISNNAVTLAKLSDINVNQIIGRVSSGSGDPEALNPGQIRGILGIEDGATADQTASEILTLIKTVDGSGSGLDADTLDGISSASFLRSDAADTASGDITFSGGSGAVTIAADSDIILNSGNTWNGNSAGKIQHYASYLYINIGANGIIFRESSTDRWAIDGDGHFTPKSDSAYNLGSNSVRVANGYFDTLYGDGANLTSLPSQTDQNFTTALKNKLDGIAASATNVTNNNQLTNGAGYITSASLSGVNDGGNAASLDGIDSSQFVRNDQNTTITADLFINGGAGGVSVNAGSDIRFTNGDWTGNVNGTAKIQHHSNYLYISGGTSGIIFRENNDNRWIIDGSGHFDPAADSTYDIGQSDKRVRNGYFDTLYGDGSNLSGLVAFPSGTRMIFQQTSAPTGWTKDTSDTNQRALRVVSGSASSGGSVDFTTAFASKGVSGSVANGGNNTNNGGNNTNNATAGGSVNNHTLSTGRMPSHRHTGGAKGIHDAANGQYGTISNVGNLEYPLVRYTNGHANYDLYYTSYTGSSQAHNHGFSGSAHSHSINSHSHSINAHNHSFSGTAINLAVRYLDVIIAQKD